MKCLLVSCCMLSLLQNGLMANGPVDQDFRKKIGEMLIVAVAVDRARWHAPKRNPNTNTMQDEINNVWYLRMTQPYWLDVPL